ncbi:hypothetical protein D9M68_983320 [compost metagenome]
MRLQVGEIDVEAFKAEIGEGIHFLGRGNGLLPSHQQQRRAELAQSFVERPLFGEAAEGGAGGAMIGVEMGLERRRAGIERGLGQVDIVARQRDDDRELA